MATRQPLRGGSEKIYEVITNFSQGIDKKVADDISLDSSFKELKNFYNASEGYLSKRPGAIDTNLDKFIDKIVSMQFDPTKFRIGENRFGESSESLFTKLTDFNNTVMLGLEKVGKDYEGSSFTFQADKAIGFQLIKNNFFLEAMQEYERLLQGEYLEAVGSNLIEFACITVIGGFYRIKNNTTGEYSAKKNGIYVARFSVKMEYNNEGYYNVTFELDSVDSTMNPQSVDGVYKCRWDFVPDDYREGEEDPQPAKSIDISNYNGKSYIATGSNYLIRIEQNPEQHTPGTYEGETNVITQIGGYNQDNVYRPTPIELTQIGFNILAKEPFTHYEVGEGNTPKIRGAFFSMDIEKEGNNIKQPIALTVPYNKPFYIHILYTTDGNTEPNKPQYREDNGEIDVEKNAYKDLVGDWTDDTKKVFRCEGIDSSMKFELKITLGEDTYLTYFTTTSTPIEETGNIDDISKLVFSSKHSKIINNQLVLYGGHGYLFFSEYDDFTYFPNYYYVYIASEAGEEEVTGIAYFRQYYAIFTNKRIKRMTGAFGAENFGIYPLSDFVGCPNGRTIRALGNNLLFLGNDGVYKLKQGYLGEGTENIEKIDDALDGELNLNNVIQAFVMNNNYVLIKNDGKTWIVYNTQTDAFYEYELESVDNKVYLGEDEDPFVKKKRLPFYSIFQANLYDEHGDFFVVPMYKYEYNDDYTIIDKKGMSIMVFRFNDLDFIETSLRHKDGAGFISSFETHAMNMGYPTHIKKFKSIFIKMINDSGHIIPLFITIKVDDTTVIDPSKYIVAYDEETDTYFYVAKAENNYELVTAKVLGEIKLGKDKLGKHTVQQIKIKLDDAKGKSLKIILSDGYDDRTSLGVGDEGLKGEPIRNRNLYDFSLSTIGIVYKLKKVKEG